MSAIWLYAGRIGLGWAHDVFILHVTCSYISHAYVLSFQYTYYIWTVLGLFWLSLSLPLSSVCVSLCLWHLNASLLRPKTLFVGASTSSDPTPSSIQFRDENAWKAFLENFSRWGIHSERQVILADFADTGTRCHSQSRFEVTVWRPSHMSICADTGVLL